jgi:hypothetical protein
MISEYLQKYAIETGNADNGLGLPFLKVRISQNALRMSAAIQPIITIIKMLKNIYMDICVSFRDDLE